MKKLIAILIFASSFATLHTQSWQENIKDPTNFYSIREAFLQKLNAEKKDNKLNTLGQEGEEEQFRRWEYMLEPRVYPTGKLPHSGYLFEQLKKINSQYSDIYDTIYHGNWTPLETSAGFPANGYSGRLNCIAFHPLDSNIIFVGSPAGGLWKTMDGGKSWSTNTDNLPSLGVSEIVIDYKNPEIMYLATGDKDAAYFISNPYSYGLLKSTNGGETWDTTGLNFIFADNMIIHRLIMHPQNPNILMAAIEGSNGNYRGIWRTTDAGATWKNVYGGAKYALEFNPANSNILYASGYKTLLRSTDAGVTWNKINSDSLPYANITSARIAVTPANPHIVYVQFQDPSNGNTYGLYKSSDDGITWEMINQYSITTQATYDWVLTLSPVDTNLVLYGGQYLYSSYDGGKTQQEIPCGHVDHHALAYRPGTTELYNCNDGGIYKSYDNGLTWENLNKTLQTFQYYRLGSSATDENLILTGAQDNGVQRHNLLSWDEIPVLADGTECLYDYTDTSIFYFQYQYGYLLAAGIPGFEQPPYAGDNKFYPWVTPYIIHPTNPKILYIAGKDIYKTTDRCSTWSLFTNQLTAADNIGGGYLRSMAISESNPDNVLYAASYVVLYKTNDAGTTWQNVTSNLPTTAGCFDCSAISSIAVHPENPNIVWVAMSGYSAVNKVFKTTDGGATWENISENLPYVPVNTIVYQKNSKDVLYIGTDLGVFVKDSTDKNWKPFMKGLPNVPVQELEIHYGSGKLRAATFGRGLWESDLYGKITTVDESNEKANDWLYPNPANSFIELPDLLQNNNSKICIYTSIGVNVYDGNYSKRIDVSFLSPGIYFLKAGSRMYKFVKI